MSAAAFAIAGAFSFAAGTLVTRRGVIKVVDTAVGVLIATPLSVLFFVLVLLAMGQIGSIFSFSWQSYLWLSAAGILHFVVGRYLFFNCVQLVGANITSIITRVSPLVAVILGISILGEPLTWELAVGALLIVFGVMLMGLNPQMFRSGQGLFTGISGKALLMGISAGLAWGLTPVMVKLGLSGSSSPVAGVFISYSAATVVLSAYLWDRNRRAALASMTRRGLGLFGLVGLVSSTAHLLRYVALGMAPASVVAPIFGTSPVFLLVLSFLFNRKLEMFNKAIIIGTIAAVLGTILIV